jgi:hypothetical protein
LQIEDLCLAEKTTALPVVIRRCMTECSDQAKFDSGVLPGLVRLIFSVLSRCHIDFDDDQSRQAEQNLEKLLKNGRNVALAEPVDGVDKDEIADRAARFVVSRIYSALEEAKFCMDPSSVGVDARFEAPIVSVKGDALASLVSKRQTHKLTAKKACVAARSSLEKLIASQSGNTSLPEIMVNGGTERDVMNGTSDNPLFALVDQETKEKFDRRKLQLEELKSQIQEGESQKLKDLRAAVGALEMERLTVQEKIAELKMSLQRLEAEDEEIAFKIGSVEGDIAQEQMKGTAQAKQLQTRLKEAKEAANFGNLVGSLAGLLKAYGKSLEVATTKTVESIEESKSAEELAFDKMEIYLQQARGYFLSEAQCMEQLKSRIDSNKNEVSSLRMELVQVAGLGMSTTINQIEESIATTESSIATDSKVLASFTMDATSMFNDFMSRLDSYADATNTGKGDLPKSLSRLLIDIPAAVKKLEIPGGERLDAYIPDVSAFEPVITTKFTATTASSVATPPPPPGAASAPFASSKPPAIAPKLTWATAAKPAAAPKTSLLDIQKEELQSKDGS